jgi:hypothetical protein
MGFAPTADAMRRAGVVLAGATIADGMLTLPNLGTISPADLAHSIRAEMPEAFSDLSMNHNRPAGGNLTERMKAEVAATRKQGALPSDWDAVRRTKTGLTASFMDQVAARRRQGV